MPSFEISLRCEGLTKCFGGLTAIDRLDLEIRRGSFVGILGPNGSGKTTLFNIITGLLRLTSGRLTYEGTDLTNASAQRIFRAGIARTFQRSRLYLGLSIFDNLAIGCHIQLNNGIWTNLMFRGPLRRSLDEVADRARQLMGIFDPRLFDRLGEPVGKQPMIDRRRIEICRALMSRPKVLLLDEPSAGMTETEMYQLMDNLLAVKEQTGELTIVLIEHEMRLIERNTDQCVALNFGRKICEGTYADVITNPEVQMAYLGMQAPRKSKNERRTHR